MHARRRATYCIVSVKHFHRVEHGIAGSQPVAWFVAERPRPLTSLKATISRHSSNRRLGRGAWRLNASPPAA